MSQCRVLIVDDTPATVDLTAFVLKAAGFVVASATDSESAIVRVQLFRPDLILMDVQMPGVDGLALTRRLKIDPATRHIVVVAFTAFAMSGDEAKVRAAGCDGYIAKPFDVASFAETVHAYIHPSSGNEDQGAMA
jgi:two-component system cell cycle response regulator DivK